MLDLSIENDLGRETVRRGREGFQLEERILEIDRKFIPWTAWV